MAERVIEPPTAPTGGSPADPVVDPETARAAWLDRLTLHTERDRPAPAVLLPPPEHVVALAGRGHVTVAWSPVAGAAGYLVSRSATEVGELSVVDHGGGDLLAVPSGPYLDTTAPAGEPAWYAVTSLATIEADGGPHSTPVLAQLGPADGLVEIHVDAGRAVGPVARPWRPMIGSEHLALLLDGPGAGPGGSDVGAELAEAFRIVHAELGVETVRAHGILDDALAVYREMDGVPIHDFRLVDDVLERTLATGLRPVVELSFMPHALAVDPAATVFTYGAGVSPPRSLERWADLVGAVVRHLVERFGLDEVRSWAFEVWNEPNMRLFWTGSEADYIRLYGAAVAAVRAVEPSLRVGGPATAAAGWIDDFLAACRDDSLPLDFLSTHAYGVAPLDLRPNLARADLPAVPLWWTEWAVSPRHGAAVNDSVWAAAMIARGMRSAAGRVAALAYWVASDHFEELGNASTLFHGGFGLLTVGNLRKPGFWALRMLEQLGRDELPVETSGDGSGSLVEAWASWDPGGRVAVALWNGTPDQSKAGGSAALDRTITLVVDGLAAGPYRLQHHRVDADHSNIVATWERLGRPAWPDDDGWATLRAGDHLDMLAPADRITPVDGRIALGFDLPMPAMSLVELVPILDGS